MAMGMEPLEALLHKNSQTRALVDGACSACGRPVAVRRWGRSSGGTQRLHRPHPLFACVLQPFVELIRRADSVGQQLLDPVPQQQRRVFLGRHLRNVLLPLAEVRAANPLAWEAERGRSAGQGAVGPCSVVTGGVLGVSPRDLQVVPAAPVASCIFPKGVVHVPLVLALPGVGRGDPRHLGRSEGVGGVEKRLVQIGPQLKRALLRQVSVVGEPFP
mmetsp:Transcript_141974/g.247491  ORF Transcript_141974/g.247491 Transcript_141974/m.247491 type:complete len:216 (-) Transcript_141974:322-969(-)